MDLRRSSTVQRQKWHVHAAIALGIVAVVIGGGIWYHLSGPSQGLDTQRFQLVTLTTGDSYIGHLSSLGGSYIVLDDVYYQQGSQKGDKTADSGSQITVVRLSDSVAKPDNTMHIARDKIVHWENLSNDSKIVQAIRQASSQ